jgi:UDP-glucuronate decarboxylase
MMGTPDDFTGPINIGNPVETTILELAKTVVTLAKSKSKIVHKPLPADDPKQRCPDITLAQKILDWQPRTSLEEGLKKTAHYFKDTLVG